MKHFKFILLIAAVSILGFFTDIGYAQNGANISEITIEDDLKAAILGNAEIKDLLPQNYKEDKLTLKYNPTLPQPYLLIIYNPQGINSNYKKVEYTIKVNFEQDNLLSIDDFSAENMGKSCNELNVVKFKNDLISKTELYIHSQKIIKYGNKWIIPKLFGSVNDIKVEYNGSTKQKLIDGKVSQIGVDDKNESRAKVVLNFNFGEKGISFKIKDIENGKSLDNACLKIIIEKDIVKEIKQPPYTLLILDDPIFKYAYNASCPFYISVEKPFNESDNKIDLTPEKVNLTINLVDNNSYNNSIKKTFTPKSISYNRKDFPIKTEVIREMFSGIIDDKIWTFANPNVKVEQPLKQSSNIDISVKRSTVSTTFYIDFNLNPSIIEDRTTILKTISENLEITPFIEKSSLSKTIESNLIKFTTEFPKQVQLGDKIQVKFNVPGLTFVPQKIEFNSEKPQKVEIKRNKHLHIFYIEITYLDYKDVDAEINKIIKKCCSYNDEILIIITGDNGPTFYDIKPLTNDYRLPNTDIEQARTANPKSDIGIINDKFNSKFKSNSNEGFVFDYYLFVSTNLLDNPSNLKIFNDWVIEYSNLSPMSKIRIYCAKKYDSFDSFKWEYTTIKEYHE